MTKQRQKNITDDADKYVELLVSCRDGERNLRRREESQAKVDASIIIFFWRIFVVCIPKEGKTETM